MLLKFTDVSYIVKRLYDTTLEGTLDSTNGLKVELTIYLDEPFSKFEEVINNLSKTTQFSITEDDGTIIESHSAAQAVVTRSFDATTENISDRYTIQVRLNRIF